MILNRSKQSSVGFLAGVSTIGQLITQGFQSFYMSIKDRSSKNSSQCTRQDPKSTKEYRLDIKQRGILVTSYENTRYSPTMVSTNKKSVKQKRTKSVRATY